MLVGIGFAFLVEPALAVWFFVKAWDLALNLMPTGATNAMLGSTSWILFGGTRSVRPGGRVAGARRMVPAAGDRRCAARPSGVM